MLPSPIEALDERPALLSEGSFSLIQQPQRPGELCDWLELELGALAADHIRANANIPSGLWMAIAIDADRCLEDLLAREEGSVDWRALDAAGEERVELAVSRRPARGLRAYANALRSAEEPVEDLVGQRIALTPATSTVTAWERHSRSRGQTLSEWLGEVVEKLPVGRIIWEAAAAERGQALSEWILRHC